jgi:hypothetical protein
MRQIADETDAVEVKHGYHARMIRVINAIAITGGVVLLCMSLWPGYAGGCILFLALPLVALLGVAWLLAVARAASRRSKPIPFRQVMLSPLVVCVAYGLLHFYVPRRVAFRIVQHQFDTLVPSATASYHGGTKLDQRLGIYRVDEYAAHPRGGVYFRTGTAPDGIGPDTISYGFAYRPNRERSPFGAKYYLVRSLGRDWYWFQASDRSY